MKLLLSLGRFTLFRDAYVFVSFLLVLPRILMFLTTFTPPKFPCFDSID